MGESPRTDRLRRILDDEVVLGGLGFGIEDVNEKADSGYQILNLGSTTGAVEQVVTSWLDDYSG
jgi:2-dehydro-3-deoxyglucarate aldolase